MPNLPIIATLPTPPAQAPAPTDNSNAAPPTESFNSVLARQRGNAGTSDTGAQSAKPAAAPAAAKDSPPASGHETTATAPPMTAPATMPDKAAIATAALPPPPIAANTTDPANTTGATNTTGAAPVALAASNTPADNKKETIAPVSATPDVTGALPADAATATLTSMSGTPKSNSTATGNKKEKTAPQSAAPAASTLPGDMLAMMQPAAAAHVAAATSSNAKIAPDTSAASGAQALPATAALSGNARPIAENQGAATNTADAGQAKDTAFSAVLATAGKDGPNAFARDGGAAKTLTAPVAGAAPDSLPQSGAAIISAASSGNVHLDATQPAINTPVSSDAWGKELGQKVTWMVTQHAQTAELHLNPPNLGPLNVTLKVSGDQATALFTSPHAAVRDAVTQALPQLRDMLANSGITLGNTTVNDQSPRDQQAWQAGQQQKGNSNAPQTAAADAIAPSVSISRISRHQGMVDTFA
jgi:flagellar hook-length control protein FliK